MNPPAEELYARKWKIFAVMMIGWSMSLIDISIVNIAIPELQRDLVTDTDSISWVINAYNITFAVVLVAMGRLADQFGRKRFFIIGMALFTLGSGLCAAGPVGGGAGVLPRDPGRSAPGRWRRWASRSPCSCSRRRCAAGRWR